VDRADALGEPMLDGVAAEPNAGASGEQRLAPLAIPSVIQLRSTAAAPAVSGVIRCLRPLPVQETCAPVPRRSLISIKAGGLLFSPRLYSARTRT
jgi:hypothetical protein